MVAAAAPSAFRPSFLPVVYVGTDGMIGLVTRLRSEGIGVVVAPTVHRGFRLLQEFRVAAVVFALADLQGAAHLAASGTPIVLLAAEEAEWDGADITVVNRNTDVAVLAAVIRRVSARSAAEGRQQVVAR
jgi:hypothetical protein